MFMRVLILLIKEELGRQCQCFSYWCIKVSCENLCDVQVVCVFHQNMFNSLNWIFVSAIALVVMWAFGYMGNVKFAKTPRTFRFETRTII